MHDIRIFFSCPSVIYGARYRGVHEQEKEIADQQAHIQDMVTALKIQQQDYMQQAFPNLTNPPISLNETPGPHRLQPRPARPEDLEYQQRQAEQQRHERQQQQHGPHQWSKPIDAYWLSRQQTGNNNAKY